MTEKLKSLFNQLKQCKGERNKMYLNLSNKELVKSLNHLLLDSIAAAHHVTNIFMTTNYKPGIFLWLVLFQDLSKPGLPL